MLGINTLLLVCTNKVYLFRTGYKRYSKRFCKNLHESAKKSSHGNKSPMKIEEKQNSWIQGLVERKSSG